MNKFKFFYFFSSFVYILMALFFFLQSMFYFMLNKSLFMEYEFLQMNTVNFMLYLYLDWMSLMFLSAVSIISASILMYSSNYMMNEKNYLRFLILMIMFISSMWLMILSPNMVSILLGWDGLGLTSYLLVVYYQSDSSSESGMLTIMTNRVGDVCILMSLWFLMENTHLSFYFFDNISSLVSIFCVMAAWTKSAQVPFSVWLPAAMAAPTPVSSLVHSSTLVTAGVYLMIRMFYLLSPQIIFFSYIFCLLTNIVSGFMTSSETDFKKIIALSTLSQVSLMMMSVLSGLINLAFFHLLMHAFFKSVMFMATGFVIHSNMNSQDSRNFTSMAFSAPSLIICLYITNMSLMGFPFMAGFFSKDLLLETLFTFTESSLMAWCMVVSISLTLYYSMMILKKLSGSKGFKKSLYNYMDIEMSVMASTYLLTMMSCTMGFFYLWVYLSQEKNMYFFLYEKIFILTTILLSLLLMASWFNQETRMPFNYYNKYKNLFFNFMFSSKFLYKLKMITLTTAAKGSVIMDKRWLSHSKVIWKLNKIKNMSSLLQMTEKYLMKIGAFFSFMLLLIIFIMFFLF